MADWEQGRVCVGCAGDRPLAPQGSGWRAGRGVCPSGRAIWPSCRQTSPHAWLHTLIPVDVGLRALVEATWGLSFSPVSWPKNSTLKQQRERELPGAPGWMGCPPLGLRSAPPSLSPQTPDPGPSCPWKGEGSNFCPRGQELPALIPHSRACFPWS